MSELSSSTIPNETSIGSMIQCKVIHSLPDMLVVSFENQDQKVFQGALLFTKHNLPYGVGSIDSFKSKLTANNPKDYKEDNFTVENRHTYFKRSKLPLKRKIRLRARQVLCHSCKNVCNELGHNAQVRSKKPRKKDNSTKFDDLCVKTFTLVPKVKRLKVNEIEKFNQTEKPSKSATLKNDAEKFNQKTNESNEMKNEIKIKLSNHDHQQESCNSGIEFLTPLKIKILPSSESRKLRKKTSIGSMEDLWDEAVFEDKIPYIPSLLKQDSKAAKKALKKAKKKEAKRFTKLKKAKKIHSEHHQSSIRKSGDNSNNDVPVKIPLKLGVPIMPSPSERRLASPIHCVS